MGGEKGCGGRVDGYVVSRNAFKARLTALESLRTIWTINVSSEIRTRSEGVLERFYAMVVFGWLSGWQIDPIANLGNRAAPSALTRVRTRTRTREPDTDPDPVFSSFFFLFL